MSKSYEERMEGRKPTMWEQFGSQLGSAKELRPSLRKYWEDIAREVWAGKKHISALESCPLPDDLLGALQAYEALCREYDSGEKEGIQPETGLRG